MNPEELSEIQSLAHRGMSLRAIAKRLGRNIKTIRKALQRPVQTRTASKLDPFRDQIREKAGKGLYAPRILREIRERGYTGSLTILKSYLREIRGPQKQPRKAFRRFETAPGKEAQVDWSPYRVLIAGVSTVVHCFAVLAAYSRKLFLAFYRNERLPTLLHAHTEAFLFYGGLFLMFLYDNMTTVTLGRRGGKPLWNPTFLEFSRHHGFTPRVCRPRDPNRRGKGERVFHWMENDFLRGASFESWDDLNKRARHWLDTVANVRPHPLTGRPRNEMFDKEERPLLIQLPAQSYPTGRCEVRKVQIDGYVACDGSLYPVPARLVGQYVRLRITPHRVEILDKDEDVVIAHSIPDRPGRIPAPHDTFVSDRPSIPLPALEAQFLARFPNARDFLDGLKRRMNALTPIHLRKIETLAQFYREDALRSALDRAQTFRNYNAGAVERILRAAHPNVLHEPPPEPILPNPAALGALDDVDPGSPSDYTFDTEEPTERNTDDAAQEDVS